MRTLKLLVALIVVATPAACGSPDDNGSALDTLEPPPTGEVQDPPPPGESTSTSDAASGGPVVSTTTNTTVPLGVPSTGNSGRGSTTASTGATATTRAGSTTETTRATETTGAAQTTTTRVSATTRPSGPTATTSPTTATAPPKKAQTISFAQPPGPWAYGEPKTVVATASSGLPVAYDTTGACVVDNAALGVVRASDVGECSITVSQQGDGAWKPATPVTRSITISKAAQNITGFAGVTREHPRVPFSIPLTATASSAAPVRYSLVADAGSSEGFCAVSGSVLEVQVTFGQLPRTCTVHAIVDESRLYTAALAEAQFKIDPTVVKFIGGHTVVEKTATLLTLSVSLSVAWGIEISTTSQTVPPRACGDAPDSLERAAKHEFSIVDPNGVAYPCTITVRITTMDAAHDPADYEFTIP